MPRVLLVDDEAPLRESLSYALAKEGYGVVTAEDGRGAIEAMSTERVDVVILDVMLPVIDGMEVCRRIRARSDVPIVMLTAKDQAVDTVQGLETGADDYVTKPFNTRELLARIAAVIRRRVSSERLLAADRELVARMEDLLRGQAGAEAPAAPGSENAAADLRCGTLAIDTAQALVTIDGRPLAVTPEEYALLRLLMASAHRVVTRTELIERIWGGSTPERLVMLDAHVRCLREKIEPDPSQPRYLRSVPGIGFELVDPR
jgi:two-component system response regulator RegX3